MVARRGLVIAVALLIGIATGASATITCTLTDLPNNKIEVLVTTDAPPIVDGTIWLAENTVVDLMECLPDNLPLDSCIFQAKGEGADPMATVAVKDSGSDEFQFCGPYTQIDGLPVELVEFSVD
jgi:hypothetical protein